jgi:hypothetical protein
MRTIAIGVLAALVVSTGFAQDTATESKLSGSALIDQWVKAKWTDASLKPAAKASDAEFLRRIYLDVVGQIPALDEVEKFLKDSGSRKREALVDALVKDDRYADHWADVWSGIIVGFDKENRAQGYRNEGAHDLARCSTRTWPTRARGKVITVRYVPRARGHDDEARREADEAYKPVGRRPHGPPVPRGGQGLPKALAGKADARVHGHQIQCASADHPFDKWTQEVLRHGLLLHGGPRAPSVKDTECGYHVEEQARGPIGKRMGDGGGPNLSIPDSKSGPTKPSFIETGGRRDRHVAAHARST